MPIIDYTKRPIPPNCPIVYVVVMVNEDNNCNNPLCDFFKDKNEVIEKIKNNTLDISHSFWGCDKNPITNVYPYAVVFPIYEGFCSYVDENKEEWFKLDKENKIYIPCDRPKFVKGKIYQ